MIIILEVVAGPETGRSIKLDDGESCLVGRVSGDLMLEKDPLISGRHFVFTNNGQSGIVEDLDSRNHLFIDGEQIPPRVPTPVASHCKITAGTTTVFSVTLVDDDSSKLTKDLDATRRDERESFDTINESASAKKPSSNFGFDVDEIDTGMPTDARGNTKLAAGRSENKVPDVESLGEKRKSPFEDIDAKLSNEQQQNLVEESESVFVFEDSAHNFDNLEKAKPSHNRLPNPGDSTREHQSHDSVSDDQSNVVSGEHKSATSNFSESFYVPGQDAARSTSSQPKPAPNPTAPKTVIEYESIIAEESLFVIGGVGLPDSTVTTVNDLLKRLEKIGEVICLCHNAEGDNADEIGADENGTDDKGADAAANNQLNPSESGADKSSDDKSLADSDDTDFADATALFHWLPAAIAKTAGPVMQELKKLPSFGEINEKQWGENSVMWLIGLDPTIMKNHLKKIVRLDLKTGKQTDGVLGICWPAIFSSMLDGKEPTTVSKIFGTELLAVVYEDPEEKYLWRLAASTDLSSQLIGLSIEKANSSAS